MSCSPNVLDAVAAADPVTAAPRRTAFRTAPLLAILDTGAGRLIVVGHCQVTADSQHAPVFRVLAQALWLASREGEAPRGRRSRTGRGADLFRPTDHGWRMVSEYDGLRELLIPWLRDNPAPDSRRPGRPCHRDRQGDRRIVTQRGLHGA